MALRTPLYDWHVAQGGRMVEFGGWDMPVQYSSIVEEHQTVRTAAGLFDISHMGRLSFAGADALALLQQIYTNNAAALKDGQVRYGLLCNERGGVRDDVLVYRWQRGCPLMVVNAANREKIVAWLAKHRKDRDVEVSDHTTATCMIAVQGPQSLALCRGLTAADADQLPYYFAVQTTYQNASCILSRTGYTGEDGVELMVAAEKGLPLWEELVRRGAKPCGLGARDTLRLEAAMPLYGHELTEDIDPFQAGLGWAVKMDKGDFIGREALLRRRKDASLPKRVGLELAGRRAAREGAAVLSESRAIGRVTSGTVTPTLNKAVAMAYVDPAFTAVGTICKVDVRGKPEEARVVPLPFYRRPKG
ncbi:MAG TPA: glycine cleavage system aminomethyltransferase GcvT [Gemmataceae bacterium]|nr:glycine cleavage system aminomethyltransferase GcvT [Gemmataceae bacterium]